MALLHSGREVAHLRIARRHSDSDGTDNRHIFLTLETAGVAAAGSAAQRVRDGRASIDSARNWVASVVPGRGLGRLSRHELSSKHLSYSRLDL